MKFTRKEFMKMSLLSAIGLRFSNPVFALKKYHDKDSHQEGSRFRSISYNVFNGCIGYLGINGKALTQNARSSILALARDMEQIPRRMMLELDLYQPNLINFSESADEATVSKMAEYSNLAYAFFPGGKNGKGNFPGTLFTDYKILKSQTRPFTDRQNDDEDLFTRHWGKALIEAPDGSVISVHSAHLWPFKREPKDTEIRMREIDEMILSLEFDLQNEADSILLQGDLNHSPDMEEYEKLSSVDFLKDTFVYGGEENGFGFTHDSIVPSKRIDYIFAGGKLAENILDSRVLFQGNFRLNNNDPYGYALSDHLPVMTDFKF